MTDKNETIVLCGGEPGDFDTGEGYVAGVELAYSEDHHELYVIVNDEVASMAEGVNLEAWLAIREKVEQVDRLMATIENIEGAWTRRFECHPQQTSFTDDLTRFDRLAYG